MIPDEESTGKCSRIINRLAEKYQSVSFQPHITLSALPDWPKERIFETIGRIADTTSTPLLNTKKVQCKKAPYQKITLEIERSKELNVIFNKIDEHLGGDYSKREYPHISFFYSRLPCKELKHDVKELEKTIPGKVTGKRIALVHCKGTPEEWRMLYERKLNEIFDL